MIGNGLANIYIHNWIKMDPLLIQYTRPLQHVSTLMRQLVFDLVFAAENVILLAIALNANIAELQEHQLSFAVVLLGFTFLGLVLKCLYYRYLHIWAWLIMDYITTREDGHWKCIIFSNMYLCGDLKERELLLCCIPRPLFRVFSFLCGERQGSSCTVCSAMMGVLFFPIGLLVGTVVLAACVILIVLFLPVFLIAVLPCVIYVRCKQEAADVNIIKIVDSDSKDHMPMAEKLLDNNQDQKLKDCSDDDGLIMEGNEDEDENENEDNKTKDLKNNSSCSTV